MSTRQPQAAVIYTRISEDRNGNGHGVADQARRCRELAEQLGWQVSKVIPENDVSAFKRKRVTRDGRRVLRVIRPGWQEMIDDLESGAADGVIAYDLDRAARDMRDIEDLIDAIESTRPRIPVATVTGSLQLADDNAITMARVMVAMANKSSRDTARRVSAARERKALAGEYGGGQRPFGYESDGVTLRESEAAELRRAAGAVLAGTSLRRLVASLRERDVPTVTGAPWSVMALREMLRRPRNIGAAVYMGQITRRDAWPAILDDETWQLVCAKLDDPARRTTRGNVPRWLGSLLFRCGKCGEPVQVSGSARNGTRKPGYRCQTGCVLRAAVPVDELVTAVILRRLSQPDAVSLLQQSARGPDTAALAMEANDARERLNSLAGLYASSAIDAAQLAAASVPLRERLTAAERALAAAVPSSSPLASIAGRADTADVWAQLDLERRRAIVDTLVSVTLLPGARPRMPDGSYFDADSVQIVWKS